MNHVEDLSWARKQVLRQNIDAIAALIDIPEEEWPSFERVMEDGIEAYIVKKEEEY